MRQFRQIAKPTVIEIEYSLVLQFRGEAAKRGVTVAHLAHELLYTIAADKLVAAVLDNDGGG
jgi:hypothetical protein